MELVVCLLFGGQKGLSDSPESPFPFLDLTLRDLGLGPDLGTWSRACQYVTI